MVTVESLLKMPGLGNLKVIAGYEGLTREIKSVSIMDAPDSYKWLKGGEFILTTGFMLGGDDWQLEHFTDNLIEAGCSAIGIKKGRFLNTIPQTVIQLAEQNRFPIIEIPYIFGWSEIISVFYSMQFSSEAPVKTVDTPANTVLSAADGFYKDFLLKLQSGKVTTADTKEFEERRTFNGSINYCILTVYGTESETILDCIRYILNNPRLTKEAKTSTHAAQPDTGQPVIILLEVCTEKNVPVNEWQYLLSEELEYFTAGTQDISLSMGRLHPGAGGISESYTEAVRAYELGCMIWNDRRCYFYPMLAVYDALRGTTPSKFGLDYIITLARCRDRMDFDCIDNLESYIEYGYKKAAAKLSVHENTLRYRIQKIADLLHLDLSDSTVCNILITQIKLWRISP